LASGIRRGRIKSAVKELAQNVYMSFEPRAVILAYHRVASLLSDPLLLCVEPENFSEQLEILRSGFTVMPLRELAAAVQAGKIPTRAVAITFDDGYADNLENAVPQLERAGIPASVFVTMGAVESGREFVDDELWHLWLETIRLPGTVRIRIGETERLWNMGLWMQLPDKPGREYWEWNVTMPKAPTPRHAAYLEMHQWLRPMDPRGRENALSQLREQAGKPPANCSRHRVLDAGQLRTLAEHRLMDVGAHAVDHLVLAARPLDVQREQIVRSRQLLEEIIGRTPSGFAYPYGSAWDVSVGTTALVRQAGFAWACANEAGTVTRWCDPFWLPRCLVRNWNGREFAARVREFFRPHAVRTPQGL
jgi:peptidoglycan/xylan/chitin deacetylase (PgdA/CDA1 family)